MARPLLFASLDPDVAAARGVPVRTLGLGFLVLLAVTVSVATLAVGALLVFALLLLPAAIAQHVTTRPYAALALAAAIGVAVTWLGIAVGFYTGLPSSAALACSPSWGMRWPSAAGGWRGSCRHLALLLARAGGAPGCRRGQDNRLQ